jgi:hypothetical protein
MKNLTNEQLKELKVKTVDEYVALKAKLTEEVKDIIATVATAELGNVRVNPMAHWQSGCMMYIEVQFKAETFRSTFQIEYHDTKGDQHIATDMSTSGAYRRSDVGGMMIHRVMTVAAIWENEETITKMFSETSLSKTMDLQRKLYDIEQEQDYRKQDENRRLADEAKAELLKNLIDGTTITVRTKDVGEARAKFIIEKVMNSTVDVWGRFNKTWVKKRIKLNLDELYNMTIGQFDENKYTYEYTR